jgi:hypothetical protein
MIAPFFAKILLPKPKHNHRKAARRIFIQKYQHKILMKLTPVFNFINILRAAFASIFLCQKTTKPNCNEIKAVQTLLYQKGLRKMLIKLTPTIDFIKVLRSLNVDEIDTCTTLAIANVDFCSFVDSLSNNLFRLTLVPTG